MRIVYGHDNDNDNCVQEVWEDLKHLGFTSRDLTSRGWSSNIDKKEFHTMMFMTSTYKYHVHYDDNGEIYF